ncbi:MAG TPA: hypothetical protein VN363_09705 [Anaerolineales bacterium]|nr:hypothetical protein [Anaerolineales bacterium]
MPNKKFSALLLMVAGVFLVATLLFLWPSGNASAQCGSQASSCKNCHEVQGQDPVNSDGTGWHQSHAFGDFCAICHAGNAQSMNVDEAHTGMVSPLYDINASCLSCHPTDVEALAQVYSVALGVEIGSGGPAAGSSGGSAPTGGSTASTGGTTGAAIAPAASAPIAASGSMVVDTSAVQEVVDYNQQYNETVLGQRTINWGNLILGVLTGLMVIGGGAFVYTNERRLRGLPAFPKAAAAPAATEPVNPADYPQDVLAFLPQIARLNPFGRHALQRLLEDPDQAAELLVGLSRLDPELVAKLRGLNRESRALLLALSAE